MERNDGAMLIRLPMAMKQEVDAAAEEEELYVNEWVRAVIKRALAERARKAERRLARQSEVAA